MESFFGADFSDVRIHVGPEAPSIGALAFTMGSSLYFAPGQYNPDSPQGQVLLGHELAHVVQQRQGRVRNPFGSGVAVVQDPHLEAEADRLGLRAATHTNHRAPHVLLGKFQTPAPLGRPGNVQKVIPGQGSQAAQCMRRRSGSDDDEDYDPNEGRGNAAPRFNWLTGADQRVIESTAHRVNTFDTNRYTAVYTCPVCRRMLAYRDLSGAFHLTTYGYVSRNNNVKSQRALEIDHHPQWSGRYRSLVESGADRDAQRQDYQDESRARALCRVCNGSHKYEGKVIPDYDSGNEDEDDRPRTPKHEAQYNSGQWSGYRPSSTT